ncbi:hypothetical protein [Phormidium tenue]|nr:hypothetical protein [Phormidium tenue]
MLKKLRSLFHGGQSGYRDEFMHKIPKLVHHPPDIQWYTLVM